MAATKGTVHWLCGLPGSGKTTLARQLAARHNAVLLNHDERMQARHGANPPLAIFAPAAAVISEELWIEAAGHLAGGRDVVLDWGFWTRASRDEARSRILAMGAFSALYRLNCPDGIARQRTVERSRLGGPGVLEINGEAWDSFRDKFESVAPDEAHIDVSGSA